MSEFRIHHDVNELLSLLRVHGGDGAEVYIDLLQKNRTPYVTTTVSAHSAKVSACPRCCTGHKVHLLTSSHSGAGTLADNTVRCFSWATFSAPLCFRWFLPITRCTDE